jgi:cation transport regulator ChaB
MTNGDSPPVPDPTILTTEQLLRTVGAERDYVDGRIAVLVERLDAIDRATKLLNETVNRVPTDVQREVSHLRELSDEKFVSIQTQFRERDTRQERESRDNKVAVDAAFAAQKEAAGKQEDTFSKGIDKSEAATQETIGKLTELFRTTNQALSDKVDDLKQRLSDVDKALQESINRVAGTANAAVAEKRGATNDRAGLYAGLAALAVIITLGIALSAFLASR